MPIPKSKIKSLPDLFSYVTYPDIAKALGMSASTLRAYVKDKPGRFRLEDVYNLAEELEVDRWWLLELVHKEVIAKQSL